MEKMLKNVWFWISMTLVVVNILFYMNIKGYILLPSQKEKRVENSQKQPMESITLPEILKVSTKDVFYSYDIYQTDYSGGNEANLALEFSEKVYSDDLNQHLAIFPFSTPLKNKIGENPEKVFKNPDDFQTNKLDYSIEKDKNSRLISINVKRGISKKLLIVLSKSLKDETDKLKLFRTRIYTLMLDKELKVNYLDSYVNWSNEHSIKLRFNHSVKKTALKSYLKIEPAVNWWIKDNYYNYLISGNFEAGKRYRITFFKGLPGKNNTFIGKDFSRSLRMRDYRPAVRFTGKGNYLSDKGKMKLSFETVNLSKITFVAHQVYSNNVIHYLQSSYYSSKEKFSKELAKKEIRIEDDFNEKVIHHLDLKSFLKDQETGIFIVKAHGYGMDSKDYYSEKLVMLTDMGISVKKSDTDFCVWVTSLNDLHSVENAEVKLITNKNQCLLTGKTNKDGVVHFKDVAFENDGKPYAVIVSKNEKFTVLELSKGKMELSELELLGRENDPGAYDAFIFTERGVYRPGETVHSKALVRMYEKTHLELPESFPVVLNVIRPDGNIFVEKTILLSDAGDCSWDIDIPHTARTGKYQLKMQLPESKETIGITTFLVEDFIPDKIKLSIKADEKRFQLKDTIDFKVKARHLFGAPGANRKVYAYYRIFSSIFAPKNYSSYSFITPEKKDNAVKIKLGKKTLDSEGEAIFSVKPAAKGKLSSPIEIQFVASVKEMGGRSVTRVCSRKMDTQPFYLGLKRMREGTVQRGVKERFKFVILNAEGEIFAPEKKRLKADLLFVHWNWVLSESRSGYHYEGSKEYQLIKSGTLAK
ncbi:MAG: MG2 domain-containing protein, partial [Verrucomicrobiota bacterium]|nr:MG2 domain-containing protein [Verrucomicrobiota bacterium]